MEAVGPHWASSHNAFSVSSETGSSRNFGKVRAAENACSMGDKVGWVMAVVEKAGSGQAAV